MQEDQTTQAQEPQTQPQFQVKLVQHEWVTTEFFHSVNDSNIFENAPTTAEEAQAAVQKFIDEHKDLSSVEYRLEVEDVTPQPEPVQEAEQSAAPEQVTETNNQEEERTQYVK